MGLFDFARDALAHKGQQRHGFDDGYNGRPPSALRTNPALVDPELIKSYYDAYRAGQQARRNDELSKR